MKMTVDSNKNTERVAYISPTVCRMVVKNDVLTSSPSDPNMGEWDTEIKARRSGNEKNQL